MISIMYSENLDIADAFRNERCLDRGLWSSRISVQQLSQTHSSSDDHKMADTAEDAGVSRSGSAPIC